MKSIKRLRKSCEIVHMCKNWPKSSEIHPNRANRPLASTGVPTREPPDARRCSRPRSHSRTPSFYGITAAESPNVAPSGRIAHWRARRRSAGPNRTKPAQTVSNQRRPDHRLQIRQIGRNRVKSLKYTNIQPNSVEHSETTGNPFKQYEMGWKQQNNLKLPLHALKSC